MIWAILIYLGATLIIGVIHSLFVPFNTYIWTAPITSALLVYIAKPLEEKE